MKWSGCEGEQPRFWCSESIVKYRDRRERSSRHPCGHSDAEVEESCCYSVGRDCGSAIDRESVPILAVENAQNKFYSRWVLRRWANVWSGK